MRVLSLFDGMSCGQLALQRAGISYSVYYASEIEKHAITITQANFPDTVQVGSVTDLVRTDVAPIDLLIGGSPCQGFSFSGKQLQFDDPRSQLFFEYVRLWKELQPRYFLLENVRMKKQSQDIISELLGVEPVKINSSAFSAQSRLRLYWTNIPIAEIPVQPQQVLSDILEPEVDPKYILPEHWQAWHRTNPDTRNRYSYGAGSKVQYPHEVCHTLRTAKGGDSRVFVSVNGVLRKLTPREYERLQTVPDDYTNHVKDTHRYNALGNGWTVDVIAHILRGIRKEYPRTVL